MIGAVGARMRGWMWLRVGLAAAASLACAGAPDDPARTHLEEGEAALAVGAPEKAESAYRLALETAPRDPRALRGLLRAQLQRGEGEPALALLARLDGAEPGWWHREGGRELRCQALLLAGVARLESGNPAGALEPARLSSDSACRGGPDLYARALAAEGDRARRGGDAVAAIGHYRAALETATLPDAQTYHSAASLLIEDGRREEAVALLSEALQVHPEDRALRDLMVRALSIR